ncbi:phosphotransferase family enzyme [Krasilnikovia cinnamomea]|uniref:Phosphotransferase family enzyme n=1 Tax=Krasilnikovia cinnamomea TaxID=349313 RepID=A0A4Q7ZN64_9ACTN|nr:aminoglycoside phosphotransferase family protein [Krasilnikovia cinnamomea]RZU52457.1 phosphotransferase family enzyme [Krasilnikovia cinnamomea]
MVAAVGVRIGWAAVPAHVRGAIEEILGSPVVTASSQPGGFSPGTADRVRTAAGVTAFVKAVSPALNERSTELARQEARLSAALPPHAPVPRFVGSYDDGEWVALVLEDIEGRHPHTPWRPDELAAAVRGLRQLAAALTPSPVADLATAGDRLADNFAGWDRVAADPPPDLDPWARDHLDELRAAARWALTTLDGDTLCHCDIRADNMLLRPDGTVVFVDWPWGCVGPDWLDTVLLAVNVIVYGGDPAPVLAGVDPRAVSAIMAGLAGYFVDRARQPPPPGIPTVRAFQRAQGEALLPWLRGRPTY